MAAPVPRRLLGFLLFLAIALLAAAPLGARAEWSQYGATVTHSFDGGATPPAALGLIWSQVTNVAANATTAITGTLAVGGGTIQYAFHADLDGRNPANLWLRKMAIDNGSMAANVRGWEFRETAANLSSLGSAGLVGPPRTLALSGTRLYGLVTAQNGTDAQDVLFSLDVSSGNSTQVALTLLVFRTAPWPAVSQTASRSAPAIGEGFLVFGSNDGAVYALWESNFTLAWRYATGTPIVTVPSVYGNFVYVTAGSRLNFLDLIGRLIFSVPAPAAITASPVVSATYVFLDAGGVLSAVNRSTGPPATWSQATGYGSAGTPALSGSYVLARRADGRVYAYDQATGQLQWVRPGLAAPTDGEDVAVGGGRVYLSAQGGADLVALDPTDGTVVYRNTSSSRPPLGAPIASGSVVLVSAGSQLLAFRGQPDVAVAATDIVFNPIAINGQSVTGNLTVTVHNEGDEPAADVTVRVYDGAPPAGTLLATLTYGVPKAIKAGGLAKATTPDGAWTTGRHFVYVVVDPVRTDPDGVPTETNLANNEIIASLDIVAGPSPPPQVVGLGPYWLALLTGFGLGALVLYLPLRRMREVRRREPEPLSEPQPPVP